MRPRVGRLIAIGGHTRGIGKTALAEQILRTWRGAPVAAVKISAHRHAPEGGLTPLIEEAFQPSPATQTGRYLAAGAHRAWLCRCPSALMPEAARFVQALRDDGWDVIVESNRIVQHIRPDFTFFVVSAHTDDWKPSSAPCLRHADALVLSAGTSTIPPGARPGARGRRVFAFTRQWVVRNLESWMAPPPRPQAEYTGSLSTPSSSVLAFPTH